MSASHSPLTLPTATLFVCHSMGDTNVLIETARTMLTHTSETIVVLTIGQMAKDHCGNLTSLKENKQIKLISLADILGEDGMKEYENKALSQDALDQLKEKFLDRYHFTKALFGTPSKMDASAPFQIAKMIASHITDNSIFIFNDYFYQEPAHVYWKVLAEKKSQDDWRQKVTWLAPLNTVKTAIEKVNPDVKVEVVGHPTIDAAAGQQPPTEERIAGYRKELKAINQSLLFISGTKDQEDDKILLEAVLDALKTNDASIQLRIGLHPGNQHLNEYIATLLTLLESERYSKIAADVKLIVPDNLLLRINPDLLKKSHILKVNITGDQAANAADGVASAVPATLLNQTAIMGRPVYYHQEKQPYLPEKKLFVFAGKPNLGLFMNAVTKQQRCNAISKKELEVPELSAAEAITQILMRK